jgi:hypothetical protein
MTLGFDKASFRWTEVVRSPKLRAIHRDLLQRNFGRINSPPRNSPFPVLSCGGASYVCRIHNVPAFCRCRPSFQPRHSPRHLHQRNFGRINSPPRNCPFSVLSCGARHHVCRIHSGGQTLDHDVMDVEMETLFAHSNSAALHTVDM